MQENIKNLLCQKNKKNKDKDDSKKVWYLPNHPVLHLLEPGNLRVVSDVAAKNKNYSPNGFDILKNLLRLIYHTIAITGKVLDFSTLIHLQIM